MAEDNATDRLANNRAVRWGAILGQVFAFVLSITGIIGGIYLVANGHSVSGLTALVTALGVPLAALIRRKLKPE